MKSKISVFSGLVLVPIKFPVIYSIVKYAKISLQFIVYAPVLLFGQNRIPPGKNANKDS